MVSPFSGSTDLGKLIKASTVKMDLEGSIWTGFVIGSKYNRTLVLSVAHDLMRAGEWLTEAEIRQRLKVHFLDDPIVYPCRVARYLKTSDILLVIVDGKTTISKLAFPPRLQNRELLTESELLGTRGHPKGVEEWTFCEGHVAYTRLLNNRTPKRVMEMYDKDMVYFLIRGDMMVGYSGAPLVNYGGFVVGMITGGMVETHHTMSPAPFFRRANDDLTNISRAGLTEAVREQRLNDYTAPFSEMRYGRQDTRVITVNNSDLKYAIHSDYLEDKLRSGETIYEKRLTLEDRYLRSTIGASTSGQ